MKNHRIFKYNKPVTDGFITGLNMLAASIILLQLVAPGPWSKAIIIVTACSLSTALLFIHRVNKHNSAFVIEVTDQSFKIKFNRQQAEFAWGEIDRIDFDDERNLVFHIYSKNIHFPILKNILYFDQLKNEIMKRAAENHVVCVC